MVWGMVVLTLSNRVIVVSTNTTVGSSSVWSNVKKTDVSSAESEMLRDGVKRKGIVLTSPFARLFSGWPYLLETGT